MKVKIIFCFNIEILRDYKLKFKTVVSISVINKINCYHSLLNEVMLN